MKHPLSAHLRRLLPAIYALNLAVPALNLAVSALALAVPALSISTPALAEAPATTATATTATAIPAETVALAAAITRTDSIPGAYEIVHWPEEGLLFVASVPSFENAGLGYIHVLDASDLRPIRQIQLKRRPFALALDRSTGRLYAGHTMDGTMSVIDARGGQLLAEIQLGQPLPDGGVERSRMILPDTARGLALVTSPSEPGLVWVVDLPTGKILHRIGGGLWPAGLALDEQSGNFFASGGGISEISVIDPRAGKVISTISTGDTVEEGAAASQHFFVNLAADQSGRRLFAADANTGAVYVFDIATGRQLARVDTGPGTLDLVYSAARDEIWVTWRGVTGRDPNGEGGLTVIDAASYSVRSKIPLPVHPNSLELSEDGQTLFVTVKTPHEDSHPSFRPGALDSVIRLDLSRLPKMQP
ncbi:YncE family protein [Xinfangfangia sp. D13-10-4-6]|uniref:YncE family protein n=1 Tax=Pseudogemmobacter hezensis TaxID=2737662 RepID=UPI001554D291|nr:YncE family protein [Pseudogemmobacter hezensis]NPD16067.1 YncE family protein [Pseudogemmobacter hezensis]